MEENDRGHWVEFTAYTRAEVITGRLYSAHLRFADALSLPLGDFLTVQDCRVAPIGSRSAVTGPDAEANPFPEDAAAQVCRRHLVLVVPGLEPATDSGHKDDMQVEKAAHPVLLLASPWLVRGQLHLPADMAPAEAMTSLREPFLPITGAEVRYGPAVGLRFDAEVVLVNRELVSGYWPQPPG